MRVVVESLLNCHADRAWAELLTSRLLLEVAAPLVIIRPTRGEQLPELWPAGQTVRCRLYLFGFIPLGIRSVHFERIDPAAREIQTRESDALVQRWDHLIRVRPADGGCRLRDEIEVQSGWLTLGVWLFAQLLYRYRHWRWRAVAGRLAVRPSIT